MDTFEPTPPFSIFRNVSRIRPPLSEDKLIETMRRHYYKEWESKLGETYQVISNKEKDYRAKRITDYLNLMNKIVKYQIAEMKNSEFREGSDLNKYFEMLETKDINRKNEKATFLKSQIKAGSIDVNIMTKLDKAHDNEDMENNSEALSALRGYALSDLTDSSIVFSAGMNPNLFNYLEQFDCFKARLWNKFEKKIVIKVSDFRSALIQGKFLAKKGIWVSEFRIESGLNCGGHAFATAGYLLGPILEEFKTKKTTLTQDIFNVYQKALEEKAENKISNPDPIKITVQGGIGTAEEATFLEKYYGINATGWGTPFLMVPEATTVDEETIELLSKATEYDVVLSKNSPLGVRFNYLKGTSSEKEKIQRIEEGKPGSPCTEKHLVFNTEFTEQPICTASKQYQKLKLKHLKSLHLPKIQFDKAVKDILNVECLCIGLSNVVTKNYNTPFVKGLNNITICPGPNIAYFSHKVSLKEMVDHIYGRTNIISNVYRPHMFIKELSLYIDYFREQLTGISEVLSQKEKRAHIKFYKQVLEGINYYREITNDVVQKSEYLRFTFNNGLNNMETQLHKLYETYLKETLVAN